ncbi:Conserved hypothetical protein [gamma proteobacterium HdN1]|nr:Conserved hypothetical protein [gamma proteobacterium HdN1]
MNTSSSRKAYQRTIKQLSDRIVAVQGPIRILDAINWRDDIRKEFFAHGCRELPKIGADYYERRALGFDPEKTRLELYSIERDITRELGQLNPLAKMMRRTCSEFQTVVRMLEARGTPTFCNIAQELYGSPSDVFHAGDPTIAELGTMLESTVSSLLQAGGMQEEPRNLSAAQSVEILQQRIHNVFPEEQVRVIISDGIASDAAAGSDYIKLNQDSWFNQRDLDILEVHEGWVHLGTTLNGAAQPYCTFLSKGTPAATVTQEGLAVLSEIITLRSGPKRLYKLVNRIRAITLAEDGADFLDVFNYLREKGIEAEDCYAIVSRIFRGSTPTGKPFVKDISYIKGFVLTYNFIRVAVARGMLDRLPLLFVGKIVLDDAKIIYELMQDDIIAKPKFIPPVFSDFKGLAAWLSFGRFIGSLSFEQLEKDYSLLF